MGNPVIRALTRADKDKMRDLLMTREGLNGEGAEKRLQSVEWIAFNNPHANGEPTYFIAEDDGKIIAHLGRMPMEFIIKGQACKGYYIHDLYVHPDYRAKGLGLFISNALYKAVEANSDSFCCLVWTTKLNLEIQRRRGYHETASDRYYKFYNPYSKVRKVISCEAPTRVISWVMRHILNAADVLVMRLTSARVQVVRIKNVDSRFDRFAEKIAPKLNVCPIKTSAYLNWRFLKLPFANMELLAACKNGDILGYTVVSINSDERYPEGTLVDIMADPDDLNTIISLYKSAMSYFREKNVAVVRCCLTDKRFAKLLKRFLFFRDFLKQDPVMLTNLEKCTHADLLKDIHNWHVTCSASDEIMLEAMVKP